MKTRYLLLGSTFTVASACACLAAPMIGNLDQFPASGVGDVRIPAGGVYFGTAFQTDSTAYYTLDSIALEQSLATDNTVHVQLYRLNPNSVGMPVLVAELGSPLVTSTPTPYPTLTSFVSYAPSAEVVLEPSTTYVVAVGQPLASAIQAGVLFTDSLIYVAADGWTMGADYAGMPELMYWGSAWEPGHLKFQVDATFNRPANLPPDISHARPSSSTLWPPNRDFFGVQIEGVTDPNGDPVHVSITTIVQDEPLSGNGLSPDAVLLGDNLAFLRADRFGNGNGRVYTITFKAADSKGGVSEGVLYVGVPHDGETAAVDDGPSSGYYLSTGVQAAPGIKPRKGKL